MREVVAEGRWLRMVKQDGWEWVERTKVSGVVVVVAVTEDDRLLLVEQHRTPIGTRVIELPAGLAGDEDGQEDEALADAARRELEEETGYTSDDLEHVTTGPVSAGLSNEMASLFVARRCRRTGDGGGLGDEDITVHAIPRAEVERWLRERAREGIPADPKVYAGLWFLR